LLQHLESLTWTFDADGQSVSAIYVYSEPRRTSHGLVYAPVLAADSGMEGLACVDDVARAVSLASLIAERGADSHAADLAHRWLSFLSYMQMPDGRFTNFVLDRTGRRNMDGATSYPGGAWWTARAIWGLATAYRVFGEADVLAAIERTPIPLADASHDLKIAAILALAGIELLRSSAPMAVQARWRDRVRDWCDILVAASAGMPYVPDVAGSLSVALWGYHQLHALAEAATTLDDTAYLAAAERTVGGLVRPVLAGKFYYRYPDDRAAQCAYCVSPLVQGLSALYRGTGAGEYRTLALGAAEWFTGANDAAAVMYDPASGRCFDGLTGTEVSPNCGAESSIEASLAELERRAVFGGTDRTVASVRAP
jgi:hypothetical protein